jgi:hypothetical protein
MEMSKSSARAARAIPGKGHGNGWIDDFDTWIGSFMGGNRFKPAPRLLDFFILARPGQ